MLSNNIFIHQKD